MSLLGGECVCLCQKTLHLSPKNERMWSLRLSHQIMDEGCDGLALLHSFLVMKLHIFDVGCEHERL
jgi:hypothetical protein